MVRWHMRKWLTRLFRGEKQVLWRGEPRLVSYRDSEALLKDGWQIYTPNEDRNFGLGYVWLCRVHEL